MVSPTIEQIERTIGATHYPVIRIVANELLTIREVLKRHAPELTKDYAEYLYAALTELTELKHLQSVKNPRAAYPPPVKDPWAAYPPPEGETWSNPDNLTPDNVGVKDGWRLALRSEVKRAALDGKCECWSDSWLAGGYIGEVLDFTYRTKEPLPVKDPWAAYPPPEGEEWHNPGGLPPEVIGFEDGWRLALRSEVKRAALTGKCYCWGNGWGNGWIKGDWSGDQQDFTYRTKEPLPQNAPLSVEELMRRYRDLEARLSVLEQKVK